MRVALLCSVALVCGCATPLSSDFAGTPYFQIAGPVELGDGSSDGVIYAAIAWAWTDGAELATVGVQVPFEPQVFNYELTVPGPPTFEETSRAAGLPEVGNHAMLFGVPLLLTGSAQADPVVEPAGFAAWIRGLPLPPEQWVEVPDGRVLAWPDEHLLVALSTTDGVERLGDDPALDLDAICPLVDVAPGLTLYQRQRVSSCAGRWVSLASAGERTSFQGVTMRSP